MHKPESPPYKKETHKILRFWDTNGSPNPGRKTWPNFNQQEEKNLTSNKFCQQIQETEWKKAKSQTNTWILTFKKKLWNLKVTVILIVVGALGIACKSLEKWPRELEIREITQAIQTMTLLRSAGILGRVLETWRDLLSLRIQWKINHQNW